ncbi:Uncharacterised protein [Enterobacter asburiae]|uniref:Uncharacterized protein n=1 Tax=Enterobacter asburiae TaxID=61645 RepID=A0A376FC98_ENTAS|nr:Uncharacterised protein [Enterobacter asburiae]
MVAKSINPPEAENISGRVGPGYYPEEIFSGKNQGNRQLKPDKDMPFIKRQVVLRPGTRFNKDDNPR